MEISNLLPITTRKELRIWLENNHLTSSCCWVLTTRKPSPHALLYLDAVEEALCFGWIDSTRKDGLRFPGPASHSPNSYILQLLQQDPLIYANFLAFPRLYRHVRLDTIQIKKNQPELFCKRLEKFLKNTRENRMYGEWHDGGRLLEK